MSYSELVNKLKRNGYEVIEHHGWGYYEIVSDDGFESTMCETLEDIEDFVESYL